MKKNNLILPFLILLFCSNLFGQNKKIDSVKILLKTLSNDTSKVNALNLLGKEI